MRYDKEATEKLLELFNKQTSTADMAAIFDVSEKSIIAKLSSMGVYKKKPYVSKTGAPPVKKEEYIQKIAELLDVNIDILESLEKVNKRVLSLIQKSLSPDA